MVYPLSFFLFKMQFFFHNSNVFGSCIIHILYTGCAKIKKKISGAKRLSKVSKVRHGTARKAVGCHPQLPLTEQISFLF